MQAGGASRAANPTPGAAPDLVPLVGRYRTVVTDPHRDHVTLSIARSVAGAGSAKAALEHGKFEAMVERAYCPRISPGRWR